MDEQNVNLLYVVDHVISKLEGRKGVLNLDFDDELVNEIRLEMADTIRESYAAAALSQPAAAQGDSSHSAGGECGGVAQWQPIETAPRGSGEDGPNMVTHPDYVAPPRLLLATEDGLEVGYYDWYYHAGYGMGAEPRVSAWRNSSSEPIYPTHWMPLPAAPKATP